MQRQTVSHPVSLFCAAAPIDTALLAQWENHLRPLQHAGLFTCWSERNLQGGDDRRRQNAVHLAQADCVVFLLSADFFANDDCIALMREALLRQKEDPLRIIPLPVRPVAWQESPLGPFVALPANRVAITTWDSPDEGWRQAVLGLERVLGLPVRTGSLSAHKGASSDRARMLRLLRRTYQTSLDDSLQGIAWIELGLASRPDAVQNATSLLQRLPDRTERLLPPGSRALTVYDQAEEELLILGAPGAGKSMLLLQLATDLVARAEVDGTAPLPVIVPLSSWAESRTSVANWLIDQLLRIYDVPRALGQAWVEQGQVLPLLDGLDEMEEVARPLCIAAINTYRAERITPLVVCSRQVEYEQAATRERLFLQNAVVVQALSPGQVGAVIRTAGPELAGFHQAFQENPSVRELATTPLMLSVLMLAYRGTTVQDLPHEQAHLEERVWTDYVERMARQKGADRPGSHPSVKRYGLAQTRTSLSWLARQMRVHNQTLFYGEYLQADWLPSTLLKASIWLAEILPAIILGVAIALFLMFIVAGPSPVGYVSGPIGGFLGWCLSSGRLFSGSFWSWRRQRWVLLASGCLVLLFAALYLISELFYPIFAFLILSLLIVASPSLLSCWLLQGALWGKAPRSAFSDPQPVSRWNRFSRWLQAAPLRRALWATAILGLGGELYIWLEGVLLSSWGPSLPLFVGLMFGATTFLLSTILEGNLSTIRLTERISWTWRPLLRVGHLRASLFLFLTLGCYFGLIDLLIPFWPDVVLLFGVITLLLGTSLERNPSTIRLAKWISWIWRALLVLLALVFFFGLIDMLSEWLNVSIPWLQIVLPDALQNGLPVGLAYWLLLGLYQGVTQKHLDDRDRRRFNQGLHRSLRNSLLLSFLGAAIVTGVSLLLLGGQSLFGALTDQGVGLIGALQVGLWDMSGRLYFALPLFLGSWIALWMVMGGLTILRHYTLRLLLARSRVFPLLARRFLDDATARVLLRRVGGGYGFVHRRLLDSFADLALVPDSAPDAAQQTPSVPQDASASRTVPL